MKNPRPAFFPDWILGNNEMKVKYARTLTGLYPQKTLFKTQQGLFVKFRGIGPPRKSPQYHVRALRDDHTASKPCTADYTQATPFRDMGHPKMFHK